MDITKEKLKVLLKGFSPVRINTDGYKKAAVILPLISNDSGLKILYLVRSDQVEDHKGEVGFPGGHIDPTDPTPLSAALRETNEEIGLQHLDIIGELDDYITVTGYHIRPFVGWVESLEGIGPRTKETKEVFTVPLSFCEQNVTEEVYFFRGKHRKVYFCKYQDKNIWGATMAITMMLINRMRLYNA